MHGTIKNKNDDDDDDDDDNNNNNNKLPQPLRRYMSYVKTSQKAKCV
jgi:hypothetical protein